MRALALICAPGATAHYPERAMHLAAVALRSRVGRVLLGPVQQRGYAALGFPRGLSDAERSYTTLDAAQQDFAQHGADVEALTCPVLLAWAEDDPLIPLPLADELAARAPAGPRLRFPDGGHNLQKSKAVELAAALRTLDPAGG
ncbi:MAG: alpha/beta hydrolase [Alphaproteobacteria bacterium]|nr:alpha/beta hydrolase [Alphaproteobacteria bacterium]